MKNSIIEYINLVQDNNYLPSIYSKLFDEIKNIWLNDDLCEQYHCCTIWQLKNKIKNQKEFISILKNLID